MLNIRLPYLYIAVLLALTLSLLALIQTTQNNNHQQTKELNRYLEDQLSDVHSRHQSLDDKLSALQDEVQRLNVFLEQTTRTLSEINERHVSQIKLMETQDNLADNVSEQQDHQDEDRFLIDTVSSLESQESVLEEAIHTQQDIIDNIAFEYYYAEGSGGENGYLSEILSNEEKDLEWALEQESLVEQAFQTHAEEAENLVVDCGTTLCKVEFSLSADEPGQDHLSFIGTPQWQSLQQDIGAFGVGNRTSYTQDSHSEQFIVTQFFTRHKDIKMPGLPLDKDTLKLYGFDFD